MIPALHSIAQFMTLRVLDSLLEGALVSVCAALLLWIVRRQSAGSRFVVLYSALVAIAILPVIRTGVTSLGWWSGARATPVTSFRPAITLPDSIALYFFAAWLLLSVWFLIGVVRAIWHLRILRRTCTPLSVESLDPVLRETFARYRAGRSVALCTSEEVRVPAALGLLKPSIVIPRWVMEELSIAELNQVLIHELAHLRRWDDWTNLAQQAIKAAFFFHPAVWWIEKKVALEREIACDDEVLAETASPRAYAECLAHLAERNFVQQSIALAQAALGRVRQTSLRLAQILDANRPSVNGRPWKTVVPLLSVVVVMCTVWSARLPRLIAFESNAPAVNTPAVSHVASHTVGNAAAVPESEETHGIVRASFTHSQARTITPKTAVTPARRSPEIREQAIAATSVPAPPPLDSAFRLASFEQDASQVTETVVLLIEDVQTSPSGVPVYQIQMWHVTVLRSKIPAVSPVPRKET